MTMLNRRCQWVRVIDGRYEADRGPHEWTTRIGMARLYDDKWQASAGTIEVRRVVVTIEEARTTKELDNLARGPKPRTRLLVPTPGTRCPRCHGTAPNLAGCALCCPEGIGARP